MNLGMTLHAQERAAERGIDIDTIMAVAAMGKEIAHNSNSRTFKFKQHCLVINHDMSEIITVYKTDTHKRRAKKKRQERRKMLLKDKHERKM